MIIVLPQKDARAGIPVYYAPRFMALPQKQKSVAIILTEVET